MTAVGAGVAVVAAGGSAALAATGQGASPLITGAVTTGSVTQTVEASGTIASSTKTDVTFAANGTVAEVDVKDGDSVSAGQVLAKIDTSTLQSAVDTARATLASARQQLADDESGQTSTASGAASTGTGSTSGGYSSAAVSTDSASEIALTASPTASGVPTGSAGGRGGTGGSGGGSTNGSTTSLAGLVRQIQAAQKDVVSAQSAVDDAQDAIDKAQQVVDAAIKTNAGLRDAQQSACDGSTTDASACTIARADYEAYADTLSADTDTLDRAISNQDAAVKALDAATSSLDALLGKLSAAASSNSGGTSGTGSAGATGSSGSSGGEGKGTGTGTGTGEHSGAGGSSGTGGSGTGSTQNSTSTGQVASAAQLAADQASIDSAKAQLTLAKQNLAAATLTSPLAGKVGSISLSAGSGSSGGSVTIVGNGNQIVTIHVPLSQIDQVKTGQPASIAVDGRTSALHGTVTKVGILSSTSGSLTTFPVTVTLADGSPALHNGVGADVTITTGTAADALLVPNSAISTVGSRHTVTIVREGKASPTMITLGLTGVDSSQVTAGLSAGDEVELADPGQGLPSSATSSSTSSRFDGGSFPAGGFPAGGFGRFRSGG